MTTAVTILPGQQLAALNDTYRKAVARKRLRFTMATAIFFAALVIAAVGAEVNLRTFFTYCGNFVSYFDRIFTLESGTRVWTDIGEWFWGWRKWLVMLGDDPDQLCRHIIWCDPRLCAQLFRRCKYFAGAVAALRGA